MTRSSVFLLLAVLACSGEPSSPTDPANTQRVPASISVVAGDAQSAAVANMVVVDPTVVVRDKAGAPLAGVGVQFSVTGGSGWTTTETATTDNSGRASVSWYMGPLPGNGQRLSVSVPGYSTLSASFSASAQPLEPDSTYFGRNGYIELHAGALPLIISAPHGGTLAPVEIPNRTSGETARDTNAGETAIAISDAFARTLGQRPFVVVARIARTKVDLNREIVEAAQGNPDAIRAWKEWHAFLDAASAAVESSSAAGFYIDLHGHGHAIPRLELGYLLSSNQLGLPDAQLNTTSLINASSIRAVATRSSAGLPALLHGPRSLGALLEAGGFPSVPSASTPSPGSDPYFNGGYNTDRYSSAHGGNIDGVQIEANYTGVRDNAANRDRFGVALASALQEWWVAWYGRELR